MSGFDQTHDETPWESSPGTTTSDWELAAAAVELALLSRGGNPLPAVPAELARRISRDAAAHLPRPITREAGHAAQAPGGQPAGRSWVLAAGWWTAACLGGLLFWQWSGLPRIPAPPVSPTATQSLAESRGKLLAEDPAAVTVAWKKTGDDPAIVAGAADLESAGGLGDVVWSSARQQGYMRFRGLAANDPTKAQYQL